jgi:DNA-directed RNA polymerase sigma subunit (sigma70/sigma32)
MMATPGKLFTKSKDEIVEAIKKHKGRLTKVAKELNCHYDTVRKYTDPYPEIVDLIKYLRQDYDENLCDLAEDTLTTAMENCPDDMSSALKSAFFVLNNKGKQRGYNHPDAQASTIQITPSQIMQLMPDESRAI